MVHQDFDIYKSLKGYPWRVWYRGDYLPFPTKKSAQEWVIAQKLIEKNPPSVPDDKPAGRNHKVVSETKCNESRHAAKLGGFFSLYYFNSLSD